MGAKKPKTPKPTPAEKLQASISTEAFNYVTNHYDPVTKQFATQMRTQQPQVEQRAMNQAAVSGEQAFAGANVGREAGLATRGVDPSSGAGLASNIAFNSDKAASKSAGVSQARNGAKAAQLGNMAGMVAQGKGQEGQVIGQAGQLATSAQQKAVIDARASAAARAGLQNAVGTVAGAGAAAGLDAYQGMQQPQTNGWLQRNPATQSIQGTGIDPSFAGLQGFQYNEPTPQFNIGS